MTERDCLRKGDWKRIKYYPVSVEKLQQASMKEVAYLIAPVNIGEDYEYFDEVKHLLIIPEPHKSIEELQQELDEKFENLLVNTKRKFAVSKESAEYHHNRNFNNIIDNFEYARENGGFESKLDYTTLSVFGDGSNSISFTTQFRIGVDEVGYWDIPPNIQVYLRKKPNMIVRFFTKLLLDFEWKSTK